MIDPLPGKLTAALAAITLLAGCGGDDHEMASSPDWVRGIRAAVEAVEDELGGPQEYFEVTANPQFTNVFVAVDGASEAVPYLYADGNLESPGPSLTGVGGRTFEADAIAFDQDRVVSRIAEELPDSSIDGLSVEGGPNGSVRYVATVRSAAGGVLDVVVGADGEILSVAPL